MLFIRNNRNSRKKFTLIELIAVMAIFIVIVAIVTSLYNTAHKATSTTNEHTMTFENAKIALDLMTKELQCIYYEQGTIPFWWHKLPGDSSGAWNEYSNELLAFVTATNLKQNVNCSTKLSEVKYQLYYTNDGTNSNAGWLRRSVTGNKLSTFDALGEAEDNPKWNYYNNLIVGYTTDDIPSTNSPRAAFTVNSLSSEDFQKVIPYVTDLTFNCFNDESDTGPCCDTTISMASDDCTATELPFSIDLTLKVMDKNSWQKWIDIGGDPSLENETSAAETFRKQHERTFKKTILIGNRGQYD